MEPLKYMNMQTDYIYIYTGIVTMAFKYLKYPVFICGSKYNIHYAYTRINIIISNHFQCQGVRNLLFVLFFCTQLYTLIKFC